MGIPKAFRWLSERYPLTSQLVQENRVPEFDNLYLDMNGIIHNASHPSDEASFRLTEDKMFIGIFNYIEHLYSKIKPKKVFFMAIDGVAPRAKMNQQRSRRFRTAKERLDAERQARLKGAEMPEEAAFDSNCITPGTEFMAKLSLQLKYFVAKKVSEDSDWQGVEIVLSGHEVPGEGEHKIMEFIRLAKAQDGYNPNTRHCMYGLDADLIMLGLLSHDPHFCLLREEVVFGNSRKSKTKQTIDQQNFYLFHLSLFREYLELEFQSVKSQISFEYNFERIIDDFILLAMFVGNDFLPHLPALHINEGALQLMFGIYKKILPKAGGYINDHGEMNLDRLQLVFNELIQFEREVFIEEFADSSWFKGKQSDQNQALEKAKAKGKLVLTPQQKIIYETIKKWVLEQVSKSRGKISEAALRLPAIYGAKDRQFIADLAQATSMQALYDEFDDSGRPLITITFSAVPDEDGDESGDVLDAPDQESLKAIQRVFAKYDKAKIAHESQADADQDFDRQVEAGVQQWRADYYREKMDIAREDKESVRKLAFRYVEGLQWVLYYYYQGVASWGWFYDSHYAPKICELTDIASMKLSYDLGTPFHPFEQLMGVLPEPSKMLVPPAYRELMSDPTSPIIDFYPPQFEMDMNGKKQEWEAVVKIPFIDQHRLLKAMKSHEGQLTVAERKRNEFGTSTKFLYDAALDKIYPSSLPGIFPDLHHCHCQLTVFNLPILEGRHLVKGLVQGALLGTASLAGFPTLRALPHTGSLGHHNVSVFQQESKNESMIITLDHAQKIPKTEKIAQDKIGNRVYLNWPFLQEAKVVAISDELFRYEKHSIQTNGQGPKGGKKITYQVVAIPHRPEAVDLWRKKADNIEHVYSKRYGTMTGPVEVFIHALSLKGLKRMDDGSFIKDWEDEAKEVEQALQLCVDQVQNEDQRTLERPPVAIQQEYPENQRVFFLGSKFYSSPANVIGYADNNLAIKILVRHPDNGEPTFGQQIANESSHLMKYYASFVVSKKLGINPLALSKLTSSVLVDVGGQRWNLGLSLKFEAKSLKVLGHTRKSNQGWEYSDRAVELIAEFARTFPEFVAKLGGRGNLTKSNDFFTDGANADEKCREIKDWIKNKGVLDLDRVALDAEQLDKRAVSQIEVWTDQYTAQDCTYKQMVIRNIPRRAVLKPSHAIYRIVDQVFSLGDRIVYVQDAGNVPQAAKGTVIGIEGKTIDVVMDRIFMSGTTLGDRCSPYRGATLSRHSCLNITNQQFLATTATAQPTSNGATNGHHKVQNGTSQQAHGAPARNAKTPSNVVGAPNYASIHATGGHHPHGLPARPASKGSPAAIAQQFPVYRPSGQAQSARPSTTPAGSTPPLSHPSSQQQHQQSLRAILAGKPAPVSFSPRS